MAKFWKDQINSKYQNQRQAMNMDHIQDENILKIDQELVFKHLRDKHVKRLQERDHMQFNQNLSIETLKKPRNSHIQHNYPHPL